MYIIELFADLYFKFMRKKDSPQSQSEEKEYERCNHLFQAMDSDETYLACTKCGYVIENPKKKNPFF
ncbi:MAG TPA: hypothetical protein H9673_04025 [Candidatus Adamsella sp.]|nr:hypothetical protein [Candidatus Adamsella sp.]